MPDMEEIQLLAKEFEECQKVLVALGEEERQKIIGVMVFMNRREGVCVNEITKYTSLSRPAVSHHLKILKEAGVVRMRKAGTRHFYYFDENAVFLDKTIAMLSHARSILKSVGNE